MRFIAEMDPPASAVTKMQLPGPERPVPSAVFDAAALIQQYVQNQYFDYAIGHQADAAAASVQVFSAP